MDPKELEIAIRRIVRDEVARQDRRGARPAMEAAEGNDAILRELARRLWAPSPGTSVETPPPEDALVSSEILRSGDDAVGSKAKEYYERSAPKNPPATIEPASAVYQTGDKNAPVRSVPAVMVFNAGREPVSDVTVRFSIVAGTSTVEDPRPTTDAHGLASAGSWILGPAGRHALEATIERPPAYPDRNVKVTFEAIARK